MVVTYIITGILCLAAIYVLMGGKLPGQRDRENFHAALNKLNEIAKENGRLEEAYLREKANLDRFFTLPCKATLNEQQFQAFAQQILFILDAKIDARLGGLTPTPPEKVN